MLASAVVWIVRKKLCIEPAHPQSDGGQRQRVT